MNFDTLGKHPHVVKAIKAMWGTPELNAYLADIMIKDRPERVGFGMEVFTALNRILDLHRFLYPQPQKGFQHPQL